MTKECPPQLVSKLLNTNLKDVNKTSHPISPYLYLLTEEGQKSIVDEAPSYPNRPQESSTSGVLFSFSGNYNPHLVIQKDIPMPNNVAEDLSLPNYPPKLAL